VSPLWVLPVLVVSIGSAVLTMALVRTSRATVELVAACRALVALRDGKAPLDDGLTTARAAIDAIADRRARRGRQSGRTALPW